MKDQIAELARQLEEQLKFYRTIGVDDMGGASGRVSIQTTGTTIREEDLTTCGVVKHRVDDEERVVDRHSRDVAAMNQDVEKTAAPEVPAQGAMQPALFAGFDSGIASTSSSRARSAASVLPIIDASLEAIRDDIGDCKRCRLHERRTNIVFGEGNPRARLVFVGEGPGAEEDLTGRPFVGRAGQLLDKIIEAIGLRRDEVYIANIVKCRPPGNRTPERDEVATCEPFLFRQLDFIKPDVIVALGSPAFQCLLRTRDPITRSRGEWREWNGIKVMPTFHPAYLLRSPDKKRETWEDMKKVRDYLASQSS